MFKIAFAFILGVIGGHVAFTFTLVRPFHSLPQVYSLFRSGTVTRLAVNNYICTIVLGNVVFYGLGGLLAYLMPSIGTFENPGLAWGFLLGLGHGLRWYVLSPQAARNRNLDVFKFSRKYFVEQYRRDSENLFKTLGEPTVQERLGDDLVKQLAYLGVADARERPLRAPPDSGSAAPTIPPRPEP